MSRAVFLSAGGDPLIAMLAIKLWQERWRDEVDTFYVNYNNHAGVPDVVAAEFCQRVSKDPKICLIYHDHGIGNGKPITEMTQETQEDLVMLLEDDGYIFTPGAVDRCFKLIEEGKTDIVGSPRGSCGPEIWEASKAKYNLDYSGYGDVGPNWWPNFFFCKRSDLLRTDLNFGSITFTPGQFCKELDYTFVGINHGDTFVWACMQLRAMGLTSISVPQHKADPFEIESKDQGLMNWHPSQQPFEWIHAGSLSAGYGGYISGRMPDVSHDSAKQEIESRVAWWLIVSEPNIIEGFEEFKNAYREGIGYLVNNARLNESRIQRKIQIYRQLLNI